jgi:UDP-N-acetylmuramoyl-tripeptide--D-alanyl-D-alanine ligase
MRAAKLSEIESATSGRLGWGSPETEVVSISTDSRSLRQGELFWALIGEKFDGHLYLDVAIAAGACGCVVQRDHCPPAYLTEPEIPTLLVDDTLTALGDFAHYYRMRYNPIVIGITGSVGKTSTKDMTAQILSTRYNTLASELNYNNLIGMPKTMLRMDETHQAVVLEMGADRPGEISRLTEIAQPETGAITSISETHLLRMKDLKGVTREKSDLFAGLAGKRPRCIMPTDIRHKEAIIARVRGLLEQVGEEDGLHIAQVKLDQQGCAQGVISDGEKEYAFALAIPGLHQAQNALMALAIGRAHGVTVEDGIEALRHYQGMAGRLRVFQNEEYSLIDDTYNSNPMSLHAALDVLESLPARRRIAVLGDMLELGDMTENLHLECGRELAERKLDLLFTYGKLSEMFIAGAMENGMKPGQGRHFEDIMKMVDTLRTILTEGDMVLIKGSRSMVMERVVEALKK